MSDVPSCLAEFLAFRETINARILASGNREIKRCFALDGRVEGLETP